MPIFKSIEQCIFPERKSDILTEYAALYDALQDWRDVLVARAYGKVKPGSGVPYRLRSELISRHTLVLANGIPEQVTT